MTAPARRVGRKRLSDGDDSENQRDTEATSSCISWYGWGREQFLDSQFRTVILSQDNLAKGNQKVFRTGAGGRPERTIVDNATTVDASRVPKLRAAFYRSRNCWCWKII